MRLAAELRSLTSLTRLTSAARLASHAELRPRPPPPGRPLGVFSGGTRGSCAPSTPPPPGSSVPPTPPPLPVARGATRTARQRQPRRRAAAVATEEAPSEKDDSEQQKLDRLHHDTCQKGQNTYVDPETGYTVFTARAHLKRGNCCGAPNPGVEERKWRCRHCPYDADGSLGDAARYLSMIYLPHNLPDVAVDEPAEPSGRPEEAHVEPTVAAEMTNVDSQLSKRRLMLDPGGYVLIKCLKDENLLQVTHFPCTVDPVSGLVVDDAGKPVNAKGDGTGAAAVGGEPTTYTGRTAKEVCVAMFEGEAPCPLSQLNHAAYIGRELARAEECLRSGALYVQD